MQHLLLAYLLIKYEPDDFALNIMPKSPGFLILYIHKNRAC